MSARLANSLLAASAIVASYVILLVGYMLPGLFAGAYQLQTAVEVDMLMPPLTQFASRFAWVFVLIVVLVSVVALTLLQRASVRRTELLAIALSSQALVVWLAMFCYCFDGFRGPISLHHEPRFEFAQFIRLAFGVFPVTLCAILWPGFLALFGSQKA